MHTVVYITGGSLGGVFEQLSQNYCDMFQKIGFDAISINCSQPGGLELLQKTLTEKDVYFVQSFVGMGQDLQVESHEKEARNFWETSGIPFIGVHGDSPAYFFDRHINIGANCATLYAFGEHCDLRARLPHRKGIICSVPVYAADKEPRENLDFTAKEQGKLFFLKNGNDPQAIKNLWEEKLPFTLSSALLELGEILKARMETESGADIDALVIEYFKARMMDIEEMYKLRLFFIAQLDDYLRREKSTLIAEVLSDFPVEIHGMNWEHMDFNGRRCHFIAQADYNISRELMKTALGVIDMSPNTERGFHDRPMRALGMHTLCVTNEQQIFTEQFGHDLPITFRFNRDSIAATVADVLAYPKRAVETGVEMAAQFEANNPEENHAQFMIGLADALRLGSQKNYIAGMQNFFVWPPKLLK